MSIYLLNEELVFPHPSLAEEDGLLAVGGDLAPQRILLAYENGIFPWFNEEEPILWWSPDPRFILYPKDVKISHSMRKLLNKGTYKVTFDQNFRLVMESCGKTRQQSGTWITEEMLEAYCKLHELGFAHSVETWFDGKIVGGLYGLSMGKCFFGESMFSLMDNASKTALITLGGVLQDMGFLFIDCQVYTPHLETMGAVKIPRAEYLELLRSGL